MPTDAAAPARPAFEPLNELERLLIAASTGGPAERAAFEAALPDAELWAVPIPGDAAADVLRLRSVAQQQGRPATAVFTARERAVQSIGPGAQPIAFPGRVLLETIRENPAVLNPGHGYGARWSPDALAQLIGRPNAARAQRMPTHVARPASTPPGLVDSLTRVFAAAPQIKAAWLALARWNDGAEGFLLDIRAVPGETAIPVLMNRALEGVALDVRLDVVTGSPAGAPGVGLEIVTPRD